MDDFSVKKILIPESVERINLCAFWNSGAEIIFPENTKIIFGASACRINSIPNLIIWPEWELEEYCFCDCNIELLEIKEGIKEIPDCCFAANRLTLLTLPDSVCSIGHKTFDCNQISKLKINWENISFLGSSAFYNNQINGILDLSDLLIEDVILNEYVSSISANAFMFMHANKEIKVKIPPFLYLIYN